MARAEWGGVAYESEIATLVMAWLRRKQLEARMVAAELALLFGATRQATDGVTSARSDGAVEISAEAMLAMFGQGG